MNGRKSHKFVLGTDAVRLCFGNHGNLIPLGTRTHTLQDQKHKQLWSDNKPLGIQKSIYFYHLGWKYLFSRHFLWRWRGCLTRVSGKFNSGCDLCVVQQTTRIKSLSLTFEKLHFNAVYINLICLCLFIFSAFFIFYSWFSSYSQVNPNLNLMICWHGTVLIK